MHPPFISPSSQPPISPQSQTFIPPFQALTTSSSNPISNRGPEEEPGRRAKIEEQGNAEVSKGESESKDDAGTCIDLEPSATTLTAGSPAQPHRPPHRPSLKTQILVQPGTIPSGMKDMQIAVLADDILKNVEYDAQRVVYNKFHSVISFKPTMTAILSVEAVEKESEAGGKIGDLDSYEIEGGETKSEVLQNLTEFQFSCVLYNAALENPCSELGARLSAMDSSSRNAGTVKHRSLQSSLRLYPVHLHSLDNEETLDTFFLPFCVSQEGFFPSVGFHFSLTNRLSGQVAIINPMTMMVLCTHGTYRKDFHSYVWFA